MMTNRMEPAYGECSNEGLAAYLVAPGVCHENDAFEAAALRFHGEKKGPHP